VNRAVARFARRHFSGAGADGNGKLNDIGIFSEAG